MSIRLSIRSRIARAASSTWKAFRGGSGSGVRHRDQSRPGNRPGDSDDSHERRSLDAIAKGYYGMVRSALRAAVPGGWAADHYEETLHYTGWNYIAGHAKALQCAGASVEVSRPVTGSAAGGPPDAWTFKSRKTFITKRGGHRSTGIGKSHDQPDAQEREVLPEDFDLCRLLNRPNESQSGAHQRYEIAVQLSQTGTALIVKIPNRFGKTVETYVIPTCLMTPRPANSQFPFGAYYVSPAATRTNWADDSFVTMVGYQRLAGTTIDMRDLIKISFPHPLWKDEGYSPLAAGALWSDASEQIDKSRFMKMYNNADPSMIVTPPDGINPTDNEIERVVQLLTSIYAGPSKVGRIMVPPGGSKIDLVGVNPRDMDYAAGFDQMRNAIMGLHGVPLIAAGITDGGSYAAFYAALKQFILLCVQPMLDWIAEELTYQLASEYGEGLMIRLLAQSVDDPAILESRLATDISARSITKNEERALRGLPPHPDGDVWVGEKETVSVNSDSAPGAATEIAGTGDGGDEETTGISTGQKKPASPAAHFDGVQAAANPEFTAGIKRLKRELRLIRKGLGSEHSNFRKRLELIESKLHNGMHVNGQVSKMLEDRLERIVSDVTRDVRGLLKDFDESKHPRGGNAENPGEFSSGGGGGTSTKPKPSKPAPSLHELSHAPKKRKAVRGEMSEATLVGKGKDAKVVLANGKQAPEWIKPSMIMPAWKNVQVATEEESEVLVTGYDEKGRKQTVYRPDYTAGNKAAKFAKIHEMMNKKDVIFKQIQEARRDPKTKEEADCLWLIQEQATRPGSERDTGAEKEAIGATTLRAEHVTVDKETGLARLQFVGKKGVDHSHLVRNPDLSKMLLDRKATADKRDGKIFSTDDHKLRDFTHTLDGGGYVPKDFRTLKATTMAIQHIAADPDCCKGKKEYKEAVKRVATAVSSVLGNNPAEAVKSYISPVVWSAWNCPGA